MCGPAAESPLLGESAPNPCGEKENGEEAAFESAFISLFAFERERDIVADE